MALDIITYILSKKYTDKVVSLLPKGFIYKGAVSYQKDLPTTAELGWVYTVLYKGESGTEPWGVEFLCYSVEGGIAKWIQMSPDGKVIDVTVEGTSIVENGIAKIDLSSDVFKNNFETAIEKSNKIKQVNAQIETINAEILDIQTNIDTVSDRVNLLEPKVTNLEGRVDVLEPKVSDLEPRIAKAERDITQAEEDIADIQTWINQVKLDGGEVKPKYTLTPTLTNITPDSANPTEITYKGSVSLLFTANTGYYLPLVVTVNGVTVGSDAIDCGRCIAKWTKATGKLELSSAINDISYTITGVTEE